MIIMAVPNVFTSGTLAKSSEVNENFAWTGMVPIGTILPWAKSLTGVPALDDRFVECNGQTLSDAESLLDGQVIPNLNGDATGAALSDGQKYQRFLRGDTTSGGSGGVDTATTSTAGTANIGDGNPTQATPAHSHTVSTLSPYYEIVYIMRVK